MDKAALVSSLNTLDVWLIIFGLVVAIGVVGESIVGFLHWRRSNDLQIVQASENLALQRDVNDARARAFEAQSALEQFKAPRSLTDEQIARIRDKLRPFAGQRFGITTYWGIKEPSNFANRIGNDALTPAGWVSDEKPGILVGMATGIELQLDVQSSETTKGAANELVSALAAENIPATTVIIRYDPAHTYKDIIKMRIGWKP